MNYELKHILNWMAFGILGGFAFYPWAHELPGWALGLHSTATALWLLWVWRALNTKKEKNRIHTMNEPECKDCSEALHKKIVMEEKGYIPLTENEDEGCPSMRVYQCPNCKDILIV